MLPGGIIAGLLASVAWGSGDFNGGLAARRTSAFAATLFSQGIGMVPLVILALLTADAFPAGMDIGYSFAAGIGGGLGLVALYAGLSRGSTALVAPVAAIVGCSFPVVVAILLSGAPSAFQVAGFAVAILAIALVTWTRSDAPFDRVALGLAILAGLGTGVYLTFVARLEGSAIFWPFVLTRIAGTAATLLVIGVKREQWRPARAAWLPILLSGCLDISGNILYRLSVNGTRDDVAAVLSSLYPVVTVILARVILGERIGHLRAVGVGAALAAIGLIARG